MKNFTFNIFFLLVMALFCLPQISFAQCMMGETLDTYCYADGLTNVVGIEVCPSAGMAIESDIVQGNLAFGGNTVTVYSGASGSGIAGTALLGPITGVVSGNTITSLAADQCLSFVFNTTPGIPLTCAGGFDPVFQVCSQSISAASVTLSIIDASLAIVDEFCSDDGTQVLGGGLPTGGTYSSTTPGAVLDDGNGTSFTFDPSAASGTITVTYTNGAAATDDIMVVGVGTTLFDASLTSRCIDEGQLVLAGNVSPTGGTFSGPGVIGPGDGVNFTFNPATAGIGMHTITYTGPDPCNDVVTDMVEVTTACACDEGMNETSYFYCQGNDETNVVAFEVCPSFGFAAQATIKSGSFNNFLMDGDKLDVYSGAPGSGTSGTLISGNNTGDLSNDVISGSVVDQCLIFVVTTGPVGSCVDGAEIALSVCGVDIAPSVAFLDPGDFCETDLPQADLGGGLPTGGVYSSVPPGAVMDAGDGVNFTFTAVNGPGTYELVYTSGGSSSVMVEVFASGSVSFTAPNDVCIDAGVQAGLGGGTPTGGMYSGDGVTDNGNGTFDFNPAIAGLGTHVISYMEPVGCMEIATDVIEVLAACGCPNGEQSFFHCTDNNENDLVLFELCPTDPAMAIEATISQGTFSTTFGDGDELTVYSGGAGSGTGGTIVFGPMGGNLAGTVIKSNDANECLTFVSNTGGLGSCLSDGAEQALLGCAIDVPPPTKFTAPDDLCVSAGVQMGLSGGTPAGGAYSGDIVGAVSDNGDGTYDLDPSVGPGTLTITYTANGESASGTVELLDDVDPPMITGTLMTIDQEGCSTADAPIAVTTVAELEAMGITVSDECTDNDDIVVTSSDSPSGTCPIVITRTYTLTDEGGQPSTVNQTINVDDSTPPTVTGSLVTLDVEGCSLADLPLPYTTVAELENNGVVVMDNCTANINITVQVSSTVSGTCPIVMIRTYTVTDFCTNISDGFTQTINIDDSIDPDAICLATYTLTLDGNGEATLLTSDIDDGSFDNCGNVTLSLSQEDFTCDDIGPNTVTLTATDDCDNEDDCTTMVTVELEGGLPDPWFFSTVGDQGTGNDLFFDPCVDVEGGVFEVTGGGNNATSTTSDNVSYVSQTICGDGSITAKIESVEPNGYGGLMIRETTGAGSKQVAIFSNMTNSLRHETRYFTNSPKQVQSFVKPAPFWLRLERVGTWVFAYYSSTGTNFTYIHAVNVPMQSCVEIGLASFTFLPGTQNAATFSNVEVVGNGNLIGGPEVFNQIKQTTENGIQLYPNPTDDYFNVFIDQPQNKVVHLSLYNVMGQLIEIQQIQAGNTQLEWNVSALDAGTYFLSVESEEMEVQTKRIVITR